MNDHGRDGDETVDALRRLAVVVNQRPAGGWRAFVLAQASMETGPRRREMTTQRILLLGQRER